MFIQGANYTRNGREQIRILYTRNCVTGPMAVDQASRWQHDSHTQPWPTGEYTMTRYNSHRSGDAGKVNRIARQTETLEDEHDYTSLRSHLPVPHVVTE